jgi:hypothetical protein
VHRQGAGVCCTNLLEDQKRDKQRNYRDKNVHDLSFPSILTGTELSITALLRLLPLESFRIEHKTKSQLYLLATGGTLVGNISRLVQLYPLII